MWNDCELVDEERRIWFDTLTGQSFSHNSTWYTSPGSESYLTSSNLFLEDVRWGKNYVNNYFSKAISGPVLATPEIIFKDHPKVQALHGSKILLVGAGPSTIHAAWNPADYDHLIFCNHYFLKPEYLDLNPSIAIFGGDEVSESAVEEHVIPNSDTLCIFENRGVPINELSRVSNTYPDRFSFAHTRYRSKIGTVPRMLVMACLWGAKEIHIVGMDGMSKDDKLGHASEHAFQTNKPRQGAFGYDMYRQQYVILWDYVLNILKSEAKFQNLGEGMKGNLSSSISNIMFPLEK